MQLGNMRGALKSVWFKVALGLAIIALGTVIFIFCRQGKFSASADTNMTGGITVKLSPDIDLFCNSGAVKNNKLYLTVKVGETSICGLVSLRTFSSYTVTSSNSSIAKIVEKTGVRPQLNSANVPVNYVAGFKIKGMGDGGASVVIKSGSDGRIINVSVQGDDEDL